MVYSQTWTLLQRDGDVWFDDETADKTVHLRIVQDLSATDVIFARNFADCQDFSLFHLISPDQHLLVASYAMETGTDTGTLQHLIGKELAGVCEVSLYRAPLTSFSRPEPNVKRRQRCAASNLPAIQADDLAGLAPLAQMA